MIKIEVVFFIPCIDPAWKNQPRFITQHVSKYIGVTLITTQYEINIIVMRIFYNVSLFKINDCCMKYAWEFFFMSTSAGIFSLYWCNIQSPATVRQQTYKWGTPSDGWSWMSTSLCKHYTSHRLSLREMYRHSLQNNKTAYLV